MKHVNFRPMFLLLLLCLVVTASAYAQKTKSEVVTDKAELARLKAAVEANPDSPKVHAAYIKAMGLDNPALEKQYELWMKENPRAAGYPYGLGKAYEDKESPKAKPFLLKAVEIDPMHTEAWGGLWIDAERWGDFAGGRDYLAKAVASDPSNPNYSFYYASSFHDVDDEKYVQMSLAVAKRFPNHERGAQALYWLGARSRAIKDKITYFELLRSRYSPAKFNWSSSGMYSYYNILLSEDTKKALALAQDMAGSQEEDREKKTWSSYALQAQNLLAAKNLIKEKKAAEAQALLNGIKLPRYFSFNQDIVLLKAKADDMAGHTQAAYDSLVVAFAKSPSAVLRSGISTYAAKLSKNEKEVESDIWKRLYAHAVAATPFSLKQYLAEGNRALSDYKGKVVLLTYWFPGCGPCRGEFPHFENVVRKFKSEDLAYLGINIVSDQNDYVVPFMEKSGYSFIPLEDVEGRSKGNLDNRNAAPMNFLIDQDGKLIFSGFRTDGDNEDELELMINMLLYKKSV